MFDAKTYLQDRTIEYKTSGKNCRGNGWINICCPFCGDSSFHGQFSPTGEYTCWRCNWHPPEKVIQALESGDYTGYKQISYGAACRIHLQYRTSIVPSIAIIKPKPAGNLQLPLGTCKMQPRHKEYLKKRKFDPDLLEKKYNLSGTGPAGDLPHRIIIPILYKNKIVSWQARSILDNVELRYISAGPDKEEIRHKDILYNLDNCRGRSIMVVEGITDVWRMGDGCCATFGTKVRLAQVRLLAEYSRVFFVYDGETQAQALARRLCRALSGMGVQAENILLDGGDPGDMDQDEAQKLKQELLGGKDED